MHHEYDELHKEDAIHAGRLELMRLDYEEQETECIGKTLRKKVDAATTAHVSDFKYWTQVWKKLVKNRDNAHMIECTWLCPGMAACGAVVLKWLAG